MAIRRLFIDLFLETQGRAPNEIILDLDATDDPVHGEQEGRFFHGYYDCYCYLPLYVFCGRHLLDAKLRRANIDPAAGAVEEVARIVAQIRRRWPLVRILLRADSGFAREELIGTDSSTCPLQASEDSNVFETARQRNCVVPQRMARTGRSAMAVLLFRPTAFNVIDARRGCQPPARRGLGISRSSGRRRGVDVFGKVAGRRGD